MTLPDKILERMAKCYKRVNETVVPIRRRTVSLGDRMQVVVELIC